MVKLSPKLIVRLQEESRVLNETNMKSDEPVLMAKAAERTDRKHVRRRVLTFRLQPFLSTYKRLLPLN